MRPPRFRGLAALLFVAAVSHGCGADPATSQIPDVEPDTETDTGGDTHGDTAEVSPETNDAADTPDSAQPDTLDTVDTSDTADSVEPLDVGDTSSDTAVPTDTDVSDDTAKDTVEVEVACGDGDNDGVCDADDRCPGYDDGPDADADGVADGCDRCPGHDDSRDADLDGVPDACDRCLGAEDALDHDGDGIPDACDCDADNCHVDASCRSGATPESLVVCACKSGFTGNGVTCTDIDECLTNLGGCDPLAGCQNTPGSFTCGDCPEGYTGGGATGCVDIDECLVDQGGCDPLTVCSNTPGSFSCSSCPSGFVGTGLTGCADRDECQFGNGGCAQLCVNDVGSYTCRCQPGYQIGLDGRSCTDINECTTNNGGCSQQCVNTPGGFACQCAAGYALMADGRTCADIDECATNNGGCAGTCINSVGSFTCQCGAGFVLGADGRSCQDLDECQVNNGGCSQFCVNSPGSFSCECRAGFALAANGRACNDIDECGSNNGGCASTCVNSPGSFECRCPSGFMLGADGRACDDVNECATANGGCAQNCNNAPGTFVCACDAGYVLAADGKTCDDIDECLTNNGDCDQRCLNTVGGRVCSCQRGYTLQPNGETCSDVNECLTNNGGCDQSCTNNAGSFECSCAAGYQLAADGKRCVDIDECATDNGGCDPFVTCFNNAGGPPSCGDCPDGFVGDGVTGCVEAAPLEAGEITEGGATRAQMEELRDNFDPVVPEDRVELQPVAGVEATTEMQQDEVVVTPEELVFVAADHPEVLEWEKGKVLASAPGAPGSPGRNPFGFIRKVERVEVIGDEIIVETSVPALEEVITGELQIEFDPTTAQVVEWSEFDHGWAAENLYVDVGLIGDHFPESLTDDTNLEGLANPPADPGGDPWGCCKWVKSAVSSVSSAVSSVAQAAVAVYQAVIPQSFDGSLRIDHELNLSAQSPILSYSFAKKWNEDGNFPIEAKFEGTAAFEGRMKFNPRTSIGLVIPNPVAVGATPPFRIWMDIDAYFETFMKVDLSLSASVASAGGKAGSELEEQINAGVAFAEKTLNAFRVRSLGDPDAKPAGGWKKTLFISKPSTQFIMAGPVPVVFTQTFQLDLECGFEVKAELKASLTHETSRTFRFRAEYVKGGDSTITTPEYYYHASRTVAVEGGGSASISCGLIPRVNAYVYDAIGINLGLRGSGVIRANYASTCDDNAVSTRPRGEVKLGLYGNVGVQFGGRLQAPGSSYAGSGGQNLGFDVGPFELWTKEWPLIERSWNVPGIGYCTPTCQNNRTSSDERETDLDCGDQCPTKCGENKRCRVNGDCGNGLFCTGGICTDNHCADGVFSGTETDIDCGGPRCGPCGLDRRCFKSGDCQSTACKKLQTGFGAQTDIGRCVADPCFDGEKSPGECGIDCGGNCTLCPDGKACTDASGCQSGFSNGYMCVPASCGNLTVDGTETDLDCGGNNLCNRCPSGKSCNAASDCMASAPLCAIDSRTCYQEQCRNELKDLGEGDIDCGGRCSDRCLSGQSCNTSGDCAIGLECREDTKVCASPSCDDGWRSATEGDIDCGRLCDTQCALGQSCRQSRDCASRICTNNLCVDTDCFDRQKNGAESDVDCGGSCTHKCLGGQSCLSANDCESGVCDSGACAVATCTDGVKNGGESDIDCGGLCGGCPTGGLCRIGGDCADRKCSAGGLCEGPSCTDGVKNGGEGDVDCGGPCPGRCAPGQLCAADGDCATQACVIGMCSDARCLDGIVSGDETDVDCGGSCPGKCDLGEVCSVGGDCGSGSCVAGACAAPTCDDGNKNGDETGVDCGGGCALVGEVCADGVACLAALDCASQVCANGVCQAPSCVDGIQNGAEDAIDCGGACVPCAALPLGSRFASTGSTPKTFVELSGFALFAANDGTGAELWRTDGSNAGTARVKDINPNGAGLPSGLPQVVLNGLVLFAGNDGLVGTELWRTDGTEAGTFLVSDILPESSSSSPKDLVRMGNQVYFVANGPSGLELYRSNGTAAGTVLVKDINPGAGSGDPRRLTVAGGRLFFTANTGSTGQELWVSDGTSAGTTLVRELQAGANDGVVGTMAALGERVVFGGDDGVNYELHVSDGTSAGTTRVVDLAPTGQSASNFNHVIAFGGHVYFAADGNDGTGYELWRTDGSAVGTARFFDINPGSGWGTPEKFVATSTHLYFQAYEPVAGAELWRTDGTVGGTALVRDIYPGGSGASIDGVVVRGNKLYFGAQDNASGFELWTSDGTAAGTAQVIDLIPGNGSGLPRSFFPGGASDLAIGMVGNVVLFGGDDGLDGVELWRTNGSAAGTAPVRDINANPQSTTPIVAAGGKHFFVGRSPNEGSELWVTDGTAAGTRLTKDINPGTATSDVFGLFAMGDKVFFRGNEPVEGYELWSSDGTTAGTTLVKSFIPGTGNGFPNLFGPPKNGVFYLSATSGAPVFDQLWKSDGTTAGTVFVKSLNATQPSYPANFFHMPNYALFSAIDTSGRELYRTDGTANGTVLVKDIRAGANSSSPRAVGLFGPAGQEKALLLADDGSTGEELWVTDGTSNGTTLLRDIHSGANPSSPAYITQLGNIWVFRARDALGYHLWKTDGTSLGTTMVKVLHPGQNAGFISSEPWEVFGGHVYFLNNDGVTGMQIWRTDGTTNNTGQFGTHSDVADLTPLGGHLYFVARTAAHGREIWRTDGTVAGTQLALDLMPGAEGSSPSNLVAGADGALYFTAASPKGRVLWRYTPQP